MQLEWQEADSLMRELVESQKKQLLKLGRRYVPQLTLEDLWQPNDFPELEQSPHFRYEEGVLAGLQSMQMAMQAQFMSSSEQ